MDQAPVQDVDLTKGLENTLTIMGHKLKKGVTVKRDYHPTPLLVNSYGSELNQVWTNIIDNAIDAMHGKGELRIKTFRTTGRRWWKSATPAPAFRRKFSHTSSNRSSQPREWAKARGWDWTRRCESSANTRGRST